MHEGEFSTRTGLPGLPGAAEDVMVARDLILLEDFGGDRGRYHVAHLSTARSLELVRQAKRRGLRATCEVTPHHLLLTDSEVWSSHLSTDTKMKPPLRSQRDREALFDGLADGSIDAIASRIGDVQTPNCTQRFCGEPKNRMRATAAISSTVVATITHGRISGQS